MQKYDIKWICESGDIRYNRCVEFNKSGFVEKSNLLVLNKLERLLTVCKVKNIDDIDLSKEFYFIGKTDEEISLVCETNDVPENTIEREDGWRGFRIQ